MTDPISALPAELGLRVALNLPLASLAAFQRVSRSWHQLVAAHEDLVFARAAGVDYAHEGAAAGLELAVKREKETVFGQETWEDVSSWREFCRRRALMAADTADPLFYRTRKLGGGPLGMVWRLKVDTVLRLLLTTDHRGGLRVLDLDSNEPLWQISPFNLRPFAHLEYDPGEDATIVVDRFTDELEVWKRDRDAPRGHFKLIGLVPSLPSMRGYHLKNGTLAIVTSTGQTAYYDLTTPAPTHLRTLTHAAGPIGYLDKTPSTLVLCHGSSVRCYNPSTAAEVGVFPPRAGTRLVHYRVHRPAAVVPPARLARVAVSCKGRLPFAEHPLDPAAFDGDGGEWQACHVAGPFLVALSKRNRVFVCSAYERVLAAPEGAERQAAVEATCCVFDVERAAVDGAEGGEEGEDADGTNWLSVLDGRAAFGASDHLLLLPLPRANETTYATRTPPSALGYPIDPSVPPSCIQLTPDAVFFTARDWMRKVVVAVWKTIEPTAEEVLDVGPEGEEDEEGEWEDTDLDD